MTVELARRLLQSGVVSGRDVEAALYLSVVRGVSLARALVDRGALSERSLEEELARRSGTALASVTAAPELVAKLPRGMCRMLAAVPLASDAGASGVEVAAVDPLDPHVQSEFSFHLGAAVRVVRATMSAVEEAVRRLELGEAGPDPRPRRHTPAFPHGAPDSVPPPPPVPLVDEVPIPLVRRVAAAAPVAAELDDEPLPLTSSRRSSPSVRTAPYPVEVPGVGSARVSFPSSPPPPNGVPPAPISARKLAIVEDTDELDDEPGPATDPMPSARQREVDPGPPMPIPGASGARFGSLAEILDAISRGQSRDAIVELALTALLRIAERGAVFVVKRQGYQGWACNPAFGSEDDLREVLVPHEQPSVLATAAAAGYYLGPLPDTAGHRALRAVMGGASPDVAVTVVRVAGRPVLILLCDRLDDTLLGTRAMGEIAGRTGQALEQVVARKG